MLGELYGVNEIHTLLKHVSNNTSSQNIKNIEHVVVDCDSIDKVAFLKLFKLEDISGISSSEFQQLQNMLLEFHDVFSKHDTDIGKTSLVKHKSISLTILPLRFVIVEFHCPWLMKFINTLEIC